MVPEPLQSLHVGVLNPKPADCWRFHIIIQILFINHPFAAAAYLGEVADDVRSLLGDFGQDVEDERLHVKVKRLMVQEQLGQQA